MDSHCPVVPALIWVRPHQFHPQFLFLAPSYYFALVDSAEGLRVVRREGAPAAGHNKCACSDHLLWVIGIPEQRSRAEILAVPQALCGPRKGIYLPACSTCRAKCCFHLGAGEAGTEAIAFLTRLVFSGKCRFALPALVPFPSCLVWVLIVKVNIIIKQLI